MSTSPYGSQGPLRTKKISVRDVLFEVNYSLAQPEAGAVTSNLDEIFEFETNDRYLEYEDKCDSYRAYKDALYSFILGYICEGGDETAKPFIEALTAVLDSANHVIFEMD